MFTACFAAPKKSISAALKAALIALCTHRIYARPKTVKNTFCVKGADHQMQLMQSKLPSLPKPSERSLHANTTLHREANQRPAGWWRAAACDEGPRSSPPLIISACKSNQEAGTCCRPQRLSSSTPSSTRALKKNTASHFHYSQVGRGQDIRDFKLRGSVQ